MPHQFKTFDEWLSSLDKFNPAHLVPPRRAIYPEDSPARIYCDQYKCPDVEEHRMFAAAWRRRFRVRNNVKGISKPGWYYFRPSAYDNIEKYPERIHGGTAWCEIARSRVKLYCDRWHKREAPGDPYFIGRVEVDEEFGPYIQSECELPFDYRLYLDCHETGQLEHTWYLKTITTDPMQNWFSIPVGKSHGSASFLRAAVILKQLSGAALCEPVILPVLHYIFAAGTENVLENALLLTMGNSHVTMSGVRKLTRAALGKYTGSFGG